MVIKLALTPKADTELDIVYHKNQNFCLNALLKKRRRQNIHPPAWPYPSQFNVES